MTGLPSNTGTWVVYQVEIRASDWKNYCHITENSYVFSKDTKFPEWFDSLYKEYYKDAWQKCGINGTFDKALALRVAAGVKEAFPKDEVRVIEHDITYHRNAIATNVTLGGMIKLDSLTEKYPNAVARLRSILMYVKSDNYPAGHDIMEHPGGGILVCFRQAKCNIVVHTAENGRFAVTSYYHDAKSLSTKVVDKIEEVENLLVDYDVT